MSGKAKLYETSCPQCGHEFEMPVGKTPCPKCSYECWIDDYHAYMRDYGCIVCGLCEPGNEEWDWCDHETGAGCAYNHELLDDEDEYFDEGYYDESD
jgi:hypothetical protein